MVWKDDVGVTGCIRDRLRLQGYRVTFGDPKAWLMGGVSLPFDIVLTLSPLSGLGKTSALYGQKGGVTNRLQGCLKALELSCLVGHDSMHNRFINIEGKPLSNLREGHDYVNDSGQNANRGMYAASE